MDLGRKSDETHEWVIKYRMSHQNWSLLIEGDFALSTSAKIWIDLQLSPWLFW